MTFYLAKSGSQILIQIAHCFSTTKSYTFMTTGDNYLPPSCNKPECL